MVRTGGPNRWRTRRGAVSIRGTPSITLDAPRVDRREEDRGREQADPRFPDAASRC
jgi:hypothetical protein